MAIKTVLVLSTATLVWLTLAAAGGLFRRSLGGWLSQRRPTLFALSPLLALPWLCVPDMRWEHKALVVVLLSINWADGHSWTKPWRMLVRYSWMPIVVAGLLVGNIHVAFETWALSDQRAVATVLWITMTPDWRWTALGWIGPLVMLGYWLVQRPAVAKDLDSVRWTPKWDTSGTTMLDGPIAWAELWAGSTTYAVANGLALVLIVRDILAQ